MIIERGGRRRCKKRGVEGEGGRVGREWMRGVRRCG
jgi:hypothetical protein